MRRVPFGLSSSRIALAATALALLPGVAIAQDATSPATAPSQPDGSKITPSQAATASPQTAGSAAPASYQAGDIIVTAQKQTQRLQDVPIVVSVASKQQLQDAGVQSAQGLAKIIPGLIVIEGSSPGSVSARIRGVGTVGFNPGLEPDVGIFIDGVYRARNSIGFSDLGDVQQIEVLKGPQGTLYGKSTSAGVINVTTALPSFDFHAGAEFTGSNYNGRGGSASVTGPIVSDKLAGSLYLALRKRDGFIDVNTGGGPRTATDDTNQNFYTLRGQLLYKPDDLTTVRLIGDYTYHNEDCCVAVLYKPGTTVDARGDTPQSTLNGIVGRVVGPDVPDPKARTSYDDASTFNHMKDMGVSLQIDRDLPGIDAKLTSITAYRHWNLRFAEDGDNTNGDLVDGPGDGNRQRFNDFSQELRLAGKIGKLDYTVGGFYAHEAIRYDYELRFGDAYPAYYNEAISAIGFNTLNPNLFTQLFGPTAQLNANSGDRDTYHETNNSYAGFGNFTYHATSKFDLIGGVRYTIDEKKVDSLTTNFNQNDVCGAVQTSPLTAAGFVPDALLTTSCLPQITTVFDGLRNHQHQTKDALTGTVKAVYHFTPDILGYASYARGYKAGGFNLDRIGCPNAPGCLPTQVTAISDTSFKPEFANSTELGVKTELFDRKLTLNLTGFYSDFTNFQLNTYTGLVFVVTSVPKVKSKGLEADFLWRPSRSVSIQGGTTVADTRFTKSEQPILQTAGYIGSAGARLPQAPVWSSTLSGTYTLPLANEKQIRLYAGAKYTSQYNTDSDEDPRKSQKGYALVDARVSFGPSNGRYSLELWVENMFNQFYIQSAFNQPLQNQPTNATGSLVAFLGDPRTFGGTVRVRY